MTSYRIFKMEAIKSEITPDFRFSGSIWFKKVEIYLHAKFWRDILIHDWDKTTSGFGKRTAAILKFYFRFRFRPTHSHRHVILHLPAKFRVNRTIVSGVMTSYRFFKMAAIESDIGFSHDICLRRRKWICMPNFDEISQSTTEIKLLPVLENGRPPYWNYSSSLDFNPCMVIGMSLCISLPNFVVIGQSSAELWRRIDFSR